MFKDIVHWGDDGTTFIIEDSIKFSVTVLPKYFNHKKFSSFVRQLNMYGFNKINRQQRTIQDEWKHE